MITPCSVDDGCAPIHGKSPSGFLLGSALMNTCLIRLRMSPSICRTTARAALAGGARAGHRCGRNRPRAPRRRAFCLHVASLLNLFLKRRMDARASNPKADIVHACLRIRPISYRMDSRERGGRNMRFIPREKLGKKARRALDCAKRRTWGELNPVTRKAGNKKKYSRKKSDFRFDDCGGRIFVCAQARIPAWPKRRVRPPSCPIAPRVFGGSPPGRACAQEPQRRSGLRPHETSAPYQAPP